MGCFSDVGSSKMTHPKPKYLVTWIEKDGEIRGQSCQDYEGAHRLFNHIENTEATYCEVRRIGRIVLEFDMTQKGVKQ